MQKQRVFVIWTHPLFHASVRLLLEDPHIELVGATSDHVDAMEQISKYRPDAILIEKIDIKDSSEALAILESSPWKTRIFNLGLNDNELSIYHREQKTVGQVEDLLNLILNEINQ